MKTIIILSVFNVLLLLAVFGLIWYGRKILTKLLYVSESIGDFMIVIDNYAQHLDTINASEVYHGDETIQSLVDHTNAVLDEIQEFESIYSLTTDIDAISEEEEDMDDEETDDQATG